MLINNLKQHIIGPAGVYGILIVVFLSMPASGLSVVQSLDNYRVKFDAQIERGGVLYCNMPSGAERRQYSSCDSFSALREQGCYGYSTRAIKMESHYATLCTKKALLEKAQDTSVHYFDLESENWWKLLPAEIVPLSGGVYSDESIRIAKKQRDEMVRGKKLGELALSNIVSTTSSLVANLHVRKEACGEIRDELKLEAAVLADVDSDGVAELLIEGYRVARSDNCLLGTGNALGAQFFKVVTRPSSEDQMSIINYP